MKPMENSLIHFDRLFLYLCTIHLAHTGSEALEQYKFAMLETFKKYFNSASGRTRYFFEWLLNSKNMCEIACFKTEIFLCNVITIF
jgi:hypothetical protein